MRRAWRIAGAARTTAVLLALAAISLAAGLVLRPAIGSFSLHGQEFAGLAGLVRLLGGLWWRVLLATLAYNLLLRLADALLHACRTWHSGPTIPRRPAGLACDQATLDQPLEQVLTRLETLLARSQRVEVYREPTRIQVHAQRHRAGLIGPLLSILGGLVLMLGLVVNDAGGWQVASVALAEGDSVAPRQAPDLQFTLEGIVGQGARAASMIRLTRVDGTAHARRARHLWPARWGRIWVFQQDTGPALTVTATDADGHPLLIQSLAGDGNVSEAAHILFSETETEQAFAIPSRNLAFRAVSYASLPEQNIDQPVFLVEAFQGDDPAPLASELVKDTTSLSLSEGIVELRADQHAILSLNFLPGISLILVGSLSALVGLGMVLMWGYRETWCDLRSINQHRVELLLRVAAPVGASRERSYLLAALQTHGEPDGEA